MEIRELDRTDSQLVRRWWEIGRRAEAAYRPYDFYWTWPAAEAALRGDRPDSEQLLLGAFEGDVIVGAGYLSFPVLDNTHLAWWECHVDPETQRRGIGRRLTEHGLRVARERGRRTVTTEVYVPADQDGPTLEFARAMGFAPAVTDEIKVVDLPATEHLWDDLAAKAAGRRAGYQIVAWADTVPAKWLEGYCRLNEAFNDEAPLGDLDVEAEVWDEARVRGMEQRGKLIGRRVLATAAVSSSGEMVGMTELVVSEHARHRGFQSGTLVLPAHRGHALGIAMKIANHRALRELVPECRILMTGNADVNAAMNAVNAELGYRTVERCIELQREV